MSLAPVSKFYHIHIFLWYKMEARLWHLKLQSLYRWIRILKLWWICRYIGSFLHSLSVLLLLYGSIISPICIKTPSWSYIKLSIFLVTRVKYLLQSVRKRFKPLLPTLHWNICRMGNMFQIFCILNSLSCFEIKSEDHSNAAIKGFQNV